MDFPTIISAVGSVGFPIVACCIMFKVNQDQNKAHQEETAKLTDVINELKIAIVELKDKL